MKHRFEQKEIMDMNMKDQQSNYYYLLKKYSGYNDEEDKVCFYYKNMQNDKELKELYNSCKLERFKKIEDEKQLLMKVLAWSYDNLNYGQQKEYMQEEKALSILQFSKTNKCSVNCRNHAIVLTEVLSAIGYFARTVCCMPIDLTSYDNHAITVVYSKMTNKWIALDAANCCWYYDDQSEYLSVEELRRDIIERKNIGIHFASRFCPRVNIGAKEKEQMLQYLCKNMFRFYCSAGKQRAGMEVYYHLIPYSFLPSGIQYAHDIYGKDTMIISTTDAKQFWRSPKLEEL